MVNVDARSATILEKEFLILFPENLPKNFLFVHLVARVVKKLHQIKKTASAQKSTVNATLTCRSREKHKKHLGIFQKIFRKSENKNR